MTSQFEQLCAALADRLAETDASSAFEMHASGVPARFADFLTFIGVPPSPVVEAICDASDGRPVTSIDDETCVATFGCTADKLPTKARRTIDIRAGGRGGKTSRLIAPKAIHAAFTVALPTLAAGERARAVLVAPDMDLAAQALSFVRGYLSTVPALRACVVESGPEKGPEEEVGTAERITIRRPHDGKLVDIRIGAATRGGKAVRGKTLVFVGMDEACFFYSDSGNVVTDKAVYQAAIQRLVPGAQAWLCSTPWIAGYGILEEHFDRDFGKHALSLCACGPTRALNPTWDPEGEIESALRADDPDNAAREIDAQPLAAGTKLFFTDEFFRLAISQRTENLPPLPGRTHYAGSDLAFRVNSSTLSISRNESKKVRVAYLEEQIPTKGAPLRPSVVVKNFAETCGTYGATTIAGDYHAIDSVIEHIEEVVSGWKAKGPPISDRTLEYVELEQSIDANTDRFKEFRRRGLEGLLDVPNVPRLLAQMRRVTVKDLPRGAQAIVLPKMAGAHCDLLVSVVNSASRVPLDGSEPKTFASAMERILASGFGS